LTAGMTGFKVTVDTVIPKLRPQRKGFALSKCT